jgi:hypothetical protein
MLQVFMPIQLGGGGGGAKSKKGGKLAKKEKMKLKSKNNF